MNEKSKKEILKAEIVEDAFEQELSMEVSEASEALTNVPNLNITLPEKKEECIISDEVLLGLYNEVLHKARRDRKSASSIQKQFLNMVMNEGESSSASKEAIVNLEKIKSDNSDKMIKIAELMTRLKQKDQNTFPKYLAAQQNNKITIEKTISKREFLKKLEGEE